mgnify:CR=1
GKRGLKSKNENYHTPKYKNSQKSRKTVLKHKFSKGRWRPWAVMEFPKNQPLGNFKAHNVCHRVS